MERQLRLAHVIKASEDDVALLYPGHDYREIAARWQGGGAGLVAVTLGPAGVYALAPDGTGITVPAVPVQVVDTVGAGDAFAAAMLDRLVEEMPAGADPAEGLRQVGGGAVRGLLERASVSAALTCERAGAQSPDARTLDAAMADVLRSPPAGPVAGDRSRVRLTLGGHRSGGRNCRADGVPATGGGPSGRQCSSVVNAPEETGERAPAGRRLCPGRRTTPGGPGGSRCWWSGCSGAAPISPSGWAWRRCRHC